MFKKILALAFALLLCFGLISCSNDTLEVPEGMQSATLDGEPFYLFVPQNWTPNLSSGVSGAYISSSDTILVSARHFTVADGLTLDDYMANCIAGYEATYDSFEMGEQVAAVLGGEDAVRLSYKVKKSEKELTCFQISTLCRGEIISLFAYCDSAHYDTYKEDFDQIVKQFRLAEKTSASVAPVIDKHTPDGMKIASGENLEYVFYVPSAWVCNPENGMSEAYFSADDKSNVSVTSYVPEGTVSPQDYFAEAEKRYQELFGEYTRTKEETRTVADRKACTYYYTVKDGENTFCMMQTLFSYNEMIYSITYTATDKNFEGHMNDVEAMLRAFRFR